ncbi:MAG: hypothetical protein NC340_04965 [Ruminococcus flavefaciens]|nr:hypothetical protein [Ruminococcus flavefaciens]MCM1228984.1 hypothetical protein [Ruminococcus flavefaciens]
MKKLLLVLSSLILALSLVSCGNQTAVDVSESSEITTETAEETTEAVAEDSEIPETSEASPELQECHKTISNDEKPEVVRFSFSGKCADNIRKHARAEDIFNINVLHSGVVGLVGVPVELEYDDEVTDPVISFTYNKDELRGMPEKNIVLLHYNEEDSFYDTVKSVLDTDNCTVSAEIDEQGVYLLADAYFWYGCWGMDVSEYAYEVKKEDYPTDWERENDTGDIIALADKEWAMENAPDFHVSTAEELASVVWYANGVNGSIKLTLESDIDLSGYMWKSMGWNKQAFYGSVDGQNHTINGLTIYEGYCDTGFIGYGLGVTVENINFTNADIMATGCVGIVGGEIYSSDEWTNVHVSGKVIGGSDDYAPIIGREAGTAFTDCSADVEVNGEPFEYLSYRQKRIADVGDIEDFNITLNSDYTITRDEHDGYTNLGWHIERDGIQVLDRLAENELTLDTHKWVGDISGKYTIYLTAYINGAYVKVSNIIEYELE